LRTTFSGAACGDHAMNWDEQDTIIAIASVSLFSAVLAGILAYVSVLLQ
jgi:hypothetical protein